MAWLARAVLDGYSDKNFFLKMWLDEEEKMQQAMKAERKARRRAAMHRRRVLSTDRAFGDCAAVTLIDNFQNHIMNDCAANGWWPGPWIRWVALKHNSFSGISRAARYVANRSKATPRCATGASNEDQKV